MPGPKSQRSSGRRRPQRPSEAVVPGGIPGADLFMPQGYEAGYDYPLLVWLADDAGFDLGRAMARTSLRNFIAVHPRSASGDVEETAWQAIDAVRDRASVHPQRIFLVGRGDRGTDAFRIACRHPLAFGGVASLGGGFPLEEAAFVRLAEVRRLPMLLCCLADAAVATARRTDRTLRLFHAAGAMLAVRIYPGGRDLSRAVLADVNRWVMDEVCGPDPAVASACAP